MEEKNTFKVKNEEARTPPKKSGAKKFFLGCFGVILVILILLVLGGYLIFRKVRQPLDLGVTPSPVDFQDFISQAGLTLESEPEKLCFTCLVKYEGKKETEFNLTNEQASAWFEAVNSGMDFLSGTQVKIEPDKVSIVTNITYKGATYPIFVSGNFQKANSESVTVDLYEAKIGQLSLPDNFLPQVEEQLGAFANLKLLEMDESFTIEELELRNGFLHFKGTLPEKVSAD